MSLVGGTVAVHDSVKVQGFTLIEVLVTVLIIAIGLLGLASLQITSLNNQMEAYQRTQAMLLLEDMTGRIRVNALAARNGAYADTVAGSEVGLDDPEDQDCSTIAVAADRDICDWNYSLAGAGTVVGANNIGSIVGARGCIENRVGSTDGEHIVRLTIAWQGMSATSVPDSDCGEDAFGDDDSFRRTASIDVVLADMAI